MKHMGNTFLKHVVHFEDIKVSLDSFPKYFKNGFRIWTLRFSQRYQNVQL